MASKPKLRCFEVNTDIFDLILTLNDGYLIGLPEKQLDDKCMYGQYDKKYVYFKKDNSASRVLYCCERYLLDAFYESGMTDDNDMVATLWYGDSTLSWRNCRIVDGGFEAAAIDYSITGLDAYQTIINYLTHDQPDFLRLSKAEVERRLNMYAISKPTEIRHDNWLIASNVCRPFDNCVYYDISKTHWYYLCKIFPELKPWALPHLTSTNAAERQKWKRIGNYFVGYLCRVGHRDTFNWITHQVRERIDAAIDEVCGPDSLLLYSNTDGFIVQNPIKKLDGADGKFGHFKTEYEGVVYKFQHIDYSGATANYTLLQIGTTLKGSCRCCARPGTDLAKGLAPTYELERIYLDDGSCKQIVKNIKLEVFPHV